jgi:hypothetical protein
VEWARSVPWAPGLLATVGACQRSPPPLPPPPPPPSPHRNGTADKPGGSATGTGSQRTLSVAITVIAVGGVCLVVLGMLLGGQKTAAKRSRSDCDPPEPDALSDQLVDVASSRPCKRETWEPWAADDSAASADDIAAGGVQGGWTVAAQLGRDSSGNSGSSSTSIGLDTYPALSSPSAEEDMPLGELRYAGVHWGLEADASSAFSGAREDRVCDLGAGWPIDTSPCTSSSSSIDSYSSGYSYVGGGGGGTEIDDDETPPHCGSALGGVVDGGVDGGGTVADMPWHVITQLPPPPPSCPPSAAAGTPMPPSEPDVQPPPTAVMAVAVAVKVAAAAGGGGGGRGGGGGGQRNGRGRGRPANFEARDSGEKEQSRSTDKALCSELIPNAPRHRCPQAIRSGRLRALWRAARTRRRGDAT